MSGPRSSRRRVLAALAGAASALAGCGYRHGGGDLRRSTNAPTGLFSVDEYLWTASHLVARSVSGRRYDFEREVWTDGGSLDAVGLDGDGTGGWSYSGDSDFLLARAGADVVHVGTDIPAVVAVRDGEERWRSSLDAPPVALAAGGEAMYAASREGTLHALTAEAGARRWRMGTGGTFDGTLAAGADGVYVARSAGEWSGVRAYGADGSVRWTNADLEPRSGEVPPTVRDGTLYVPTASGLAALDRSGGAERWRAELYGTPRASPRVVDGTLYYTVGTRLVTREAATGERGWSASGPVTAPAVVGGRVVAGTRDGAVGYDAAAGRRRWRVPVEGGVRTAAAGDGVALVVTGESELRAYEP